MRVLLFLLLLSVSVEAAPTPFGVVYDSVPTSESQVAADMTAIASTGATWVRVSPDWTALEPVPGHFEWSWSDTLVRCARDQHLALVYTLGYTPQWASLYAADPDAEVWSHNRPQTLESWSQYVTALVRRYGRDVHYWQVWERPDIYRFRGSDQDLKALMLAADRSLHAVDPDARMIGPEVGRLDLGSINRMYRHGLATAFDILGLYPDRCSPEALVRPLETLQQRIVERKGPATQVWFTGLSWNVDRPPGPAPVTVVTEAEQAHDLVRSAVLGLSHGVQVVFWKAWRDRTDGSPAVQQRSGLERADGSRRPAARAWEVMIARLGQQRFVRSLSSDPHVLAYRFADTVVAWTDRAPVSVAIPVGCKVWADDGRELPDCRSLSSEPVYVAGPSLDELRLGVTSPDRDYSSASSVGITLSTPADDKGLHVCGNGLDALPGVQGGQACWRTDLAHQKYQMLFDVDDTFLYFIDGRYQVDLDVEVWGNTGPLPVGFNIGYDGEAGFGFTRWQWIDSGAEWKHYRFHLDDAVFADPDSDFRINALGSKGDIYVRSVTVTRQPR